MHCPNCGRELAEGEVCNCTENVNENAAPVNEAPAEETPVSEAPVQPPVFEQPQQTYYQPPQETQGYYQPQPDQQAPNFYAPPVAPQMPQPVMQMPARTDYPEGYAIKKKYVAVILAMWLGALGIHHFYLGDSTKGIIKILLSTLGALVVVGPVVSMVWAIVDAVMLLTEKTDRDANGFKIRTFEESLVAERIKAEKEAKESE